jgi:hypothetical protein
MSSAAKSVFVFGIYLVGLGAALLTVPNLVIGTFAFPATGEVWIRVVGVLVLCIAYYYIRSAQADHLDFCRWTVQVRTFVFVAFAALAALRLARPALVLFGAVDLVGAAWTLAELRRRAA